MYRVGGGWVDGEGGGLRGGAEIKQQTKKNRNFMAKKIIEYNNYEVRQRKKKSKFHCKKNYWI